MNKVFLIVLLVLATFSCSDMTGEPTSKEEKESRQVTPITEPKSAENAEIETTNPHPAQAKDWLEQAILSYFEQDRNDWSFMTTKQYDDYKTDLINSVYSHGIDFDSLKKKWSSKYEVTENKMGVGFLIGAQDYMKIIIKKCEILPSENKEEYVFKLILCDTGYDKCYESDITVIEYNASYAIDDVKEYF